MKQQNRIQWVDSMKAFSIMAVVLNHTHIIAEIQIAAYLVCLPAFFFTAGLFANTQLSPKEFFLKKTMRLLVPLVIWGVITWFAWLCIGRKYGADANDCIVWWKPLQGMCYGDNRMMPHNPPLWFLYAMICMEWLYYAINRLPKKGFRWLIIHGIIPSKLMISR